MCAIQLQEGHVHRRTSKEERLKQMRKVFDEKDMLKIQKLQQDIEDILQQRFGESYDLSGIQNSS